MKTFVTCLDCDFDNGCEVVSDEYGEYADAPEVCEACGVSLADDGPGEASLARSERQQMGIAG